MEDSLKKRYFFKLAANVFGLFIGFFTQMIIPRGLGPQSYGDFNFLTNFFTRVTNFLDSGSSIGFYTKLSQRQKEFKLVSLYFYFIGIVTLIVLLFVIACHSTRIYLFLWPNQRLFFIYLAVFWVILTWILEIMMKMTDAFGLTVPAEIGKAFQRFVGLIVIAIIFLNRKLNLTNFFFYNYFISFLLVIILVGIIIRFDHQIFQYWRLTFVEVKKYIQEFYRYSHPLFIYNLLGMITGIFDRWLLQVCGGSIQQGFLGLSYQIGAICFLFSSAMTPIITREFSIAYNKKSLHLISSLFRRHIPLLYSITAFLACFIAVNADKVALIIGGDKFKDAIVAVAIMAFYPIHQTYGQLSGSLFYATGQTKLYRNIGVFFMLIGLPVTYFLIAPRNLFGLNLGAEGLAIKLVLLQIMAANVQLYFNARLFNLSFWRYLAHQIFSIICFLSAALISKVSINYPFGLRNGNIILNLLMSGLLYTAIVFILAYFQPVLFGMNKLNFKDLFNILRKE